MSTSSPSHHCQPLFDAVASIIESKGKISFADYMNLALYHPQWGYYRSTLPKFGLQGDFITAPELSPLFGECVARWCQVELAKLRGSTALLEFGAGNGCLAATLLNTLSALGSLPDTYYILELSGLLKARQKAYLETHAPALVDRVVWLERLPQSPFCGLIIANEVLDAMPVHKFEQGRHLQEVFVGLKSGQFTWMLGLPESPNLISAIQNLAIDFPLGYCSEINLSLEGWLKSLYECLAQGAVLLIDYGFSRSVYYHAQRSGGTVMCHYRHRAHANPLIHLGLQDITAHVDFTAVQEAGESHGFKTTRYTNQARFLIDWGLLDSVSDHQKVNTADALALHKVSHQVKQLTLPTEMGELFKVITFVKEPL